MLEQPIIPLETKIGHVFVLRKSGSDSDSTTATVKTISSTSTSSGSLEKSVIQSLKAEGPKYTCENCSS
jgi:hypothetical protein